MHANGAGVVAHGPHLAPLPMVTQDATLPKKGAALARPVEAIRALLSEGPGRILWTTLEPTFQHLATLLTPDHVAQLLVQGFWVVLEDASEARGPQSLIDPSRQSDLDDLLKSLRQACRPLPNLSAPAGATLRMLSFLAPHFTQKQTSWVLETLETLCRLREVDWQTERALHEFVASLDLSEHGASDAFTSIMETTLDAREDAMVCALLASSPTMRPELCSKVAAHALQLLRSPHAPKRRDALIAFSRLGRDGTSDDERKQVRDRLSTEWADFASAHALVCLGTFYPPGHGYEEVRAAAENQFSGLVLLISSGAAREENRRGRGLADARAVTQGLAAARRLLGDDFVEKALRSARADLAMDDEEGWERRVHYFVHSKLQDANELAVQLEAFPTLVAEGNEHGWKIPSLLAPRLNCSEADNALKELLAHISDFPGWSDADADIACPLLARVDAPTFVARYKSIDTLVAAHKRSRAKMTLFARAPAEHIEALGAQKLEEIARLIVESLASGGQLPALVGECAARVHGLAPHLLAATEVDPNGGAARGPAVKKRRLR